MSLFCSTNFPVCGVLDYISQKPVMRTHFLEMVLQDSLMRAGITPVRFALMEKHINQIIIDDCVKVLSDLLSNSVDVAFADPHST